MTIPLDRVWVWASLIAAVLIGYGVASFLQIPANHGFSASVLLQGNAVQSTIALLISAGAAFAVGALLCRRINVEVPVGCAALSWMAFSFRGGPMFHTLAGTDRVVYLVLAGETMLLFAILFVLWFAARPLFKEKPLPKVDARKLDDPQDDPTRPEPLDQKALASLSTALLLTFALLMLVRTDLKQQAWFGVLLGGWAAAWLTHRFIPARPAGWFFVAPLLCALAGYVWGFFQPIGLEIGDPGHYLAPLARPLPLDYASAGVVGTIWGYSSRLRGQLASAESARAEPAPKSA